MPKPSQEQILAVLRDLLEELKEDWETVEITRDTMILGDLDFESIDAVALGGAIQDHYGEKLPFAKYFAKLSEQGVDDISVGDIVDFIHEHLQDGQEAAS